jgi:DNA-binding transcriptional LysR family regulator
LRLREEFEAGLHRLKHDMQGRVHIAAIYSVGLSEMSEIESRFSDRFPNAELVVSYLRPEKVFKAVEEDRADLGLMSYAESTREVAAIPWREEEMVVAVSPDHFLARRPAAKLEDLEGCPFVGFDEDLPIQQEIDRYLRERRVSVEVVFRFDNLQMIKEAVVHGVGISIMPERVMRADLEQKRLVAIKLEPGDLFRPLFIVHRRRKVFSELAQGLLDLLLEAAPQLHSIELVDALPRF